MALAYAGIAYELREVSLKSKPREMLDISPKGTTPVMQIFDGQDFIVLEEHRAMFLELLFEFSDNGFVVGRYENDILSLIRKDEYIDVYFFRKHFFIYRKSAYHDDNTDIYYTYNRFFTKTIKHNFLGEYFDIPQDFDGYLEHCYGKNWRTPIPNLHGSDFTFQQKIRAFFRKYFYGLYAFLKQIKSYLKGGN